MCSAIHQKPHLFGVINGIIATFSLISVACLIAYCQEFTWKVKKQAPPQVDPAGASVLHRNG
jgi:hypothetical protein